MLPLINYYQSDFANFSQKLSECFEFSFPINIFNYFSKATNLICVVWPFPIVFSSSAFCSISSHLSAFRFVVGVTNILFWNLPLFHVFRRYNLRQSICRCFGCKHKFFLQVFYSVRFTVIFSLLLRFCLSRLLPQTHSSFVSIVYFFQWHVFIFASGFATFWLYSWSIFFIILYDASDLPSLFH